MDGSDDSPTDGSGTNPSPSQGKVVHHTDVGALTQVKVAVRVRPLIGMERAAGCQPCMFGDSENKQVGYESEKLQ